MVDATSRGPCTVGRYTVHGEIASGGMASVHFGRLTGPAGFTRAVAIKRLHPHFARDPELVRMFLDEARLAARIAHPNVVATLDIVSSEDELLLVMEYVRGASLSQLARALRERGERVRPLVATGIVAGVLHGLHAAHEAKDDLGERLDIVHRDVSPQNILVGTDGVARVLDFGVAKAAGRLQTTQQGQLKGKLGYMAPEQARGAPVTRRTDVFAASVVLWETLTGERLFRGDNEAHVLERVLRGDAPAPSVVAPHLPGSLDRIVLRGLRRDPGERYATAREMAQELEASVGLASAGEIGDWVERVAAQVLDERARRIAEIERESGRDTAIPSSLAMMLATGASPDAPTPLGRRAPEGATAVAGASGRRRRTRRRWTWMVIGVGAALGLVSVARVNGRATPSAEAATASVATTSATRNAADTQVRTTTTTAPTTSPSETEAPAAPVSAAPAGRSRSPSKGVECTPPFVKDEKGHVHFKAQCF